MSAAGWARGRILVALAFLAWLDDRGTTLGAATQADVDDWLDGATHYRYLLRDFLTWASARRLAGKVTVPALPSSELTGLITEDSRWQLLSRCLRDPGPRPLFPGRSPARPVAPQTLTRRLRQHGIEPRQARNTALAAWASDLPPAVLASLLGVHIQTAVNWASHTRRDWTTYLAERVRVGTPAPRKTARPE